MSTWSEIAGVPFVLRERGFGTRNALEECLAVSGGRPLASFDITCKMGSSEAVKEAILAGLGVSVLSIHAMERELAAGAPRAPSPWSIAQLYVVSISSTRKQFRPMKHHRRFHDNH